MRHRLISTALMSFFLSFLMSCWVTLINLGWSDAFLGQWMSAFRLAWPAAAVIAFCFGPFVQNATTYITQRFPG
ncbi:DUF2798 domain-containing protein [Roseibium sp. MB-4]|jgi:hypothetical protein